MVSLSDPRIHSFDSLVLQTRKKRQIPNQFGKPQRPKESMDSFWDNIRTTLEGVTRRSADSTYNCYGRVFASRRTAVEHSALPIIFEDDGYRRVGRNDATVGDIVVYARSDGTITHVGIVVERRVVEKEEDDHLVVLSQWGFDGEFVHLSEQVPSMYGMVKEIWTERHE